MNGRRGRSSASRQTPLADSPSPAASSAIEGHSRAAVSAAVTAAVASGGLVAVQSRINGELGARLDDGFVAAAVSFGSGFLILSIAMLLWSPGRAGLRRLVGGLRRREIPWWLVLGGTAGAFLVASQGLTAATLGVALFTVAIVGGQTVSALIIDRRGFGTMGPKPLTAPRVLGTAVSLVAVVVAVSAQIRGDVPVWMLLLPVLAGAGIGWQQAANGQVRERAQSALTATFINFLVGTTVLLAASGLRILIVGAPASPPTEPWLYAGGAIGVIFIGAAAVVVRIIGVLLLGLASIAGQLVGSVVIDLIAPAPDHAVVASTLIGTALTLVGVALVTVPTRRTPITAG